MIKKLFLFLVFTLLLPSLASAFKLPMDRDGELATTITDVGVKVYYSTGTESPYLITGGTSAFADGSGLKGSSVAIYGILTSTPQGTSLAVAYTLPGYVFLRATDTANNTSELLVPPINIGLFLSSAVGNSPDGTQTVSPANQLIVFDPPIIAQDNVSVSASTSASGGLTVSNKWAFSVFYRILNTGTPEDIWFPTDDSQGHKTHDASFYGVKPSSVSTAGGTSNDTLGTEGWDYTSAKRNINYTSTASNLSSENTPMLLYGFGASSGTATGFFVCFDSNSALGTHVLNFLPPIYPRTFQKSYFNGASMVSYSFPWPIQAQNGLVCQVQASGTTLDRVRLYTRPKRALR